SREESDTEEHVDDQRDDGEQNGDEAQDEAGDAHPLVRSQALLDGRQRDEAEDHSGDAEQTAEQEPGRQDTGDAADEGEDAPEVLRGVAARARGELTVGGVRIGRDELIGGAVSGIGRLLTVLVRVIALSVRMVRVLPVLVRIVLALPVGVLTLPVGVLPLAVGVLALPVRILALGVLAVGVLVLPRLRTVGLGRLRTIGLVLTAGGAERLLRTVLLSAGLGPVLRRLLHRVRVASVVGRARRLVVRVLTVR